MTPLITSTSVYNQQRVIAKKSFSCMKVCVKKEIWTQVRIEASANQLVSLLLYSFRSSPSNKLYKFIC